VGNKSAGAYEGVGRNVVAQHKQHNQNNQSRRICSKKQLGSCQSQEQRRIFEVFQQPAKARIEARSRHLLLPPST
jgi:hypothetical protein